MPPVGASMTVRETTGAIGLDSAELSGWQHAVIFLIATLVIVSHRPDVVSNPQFWAEDGLWYAETHNLGWWKVLFEPIGGYLNTFPRLIATLAQLAPFSVAPLFFNSIAITVQALPVSFCLSSRFSAIANLPTRVLLGSLYLALPNTREINAVVASAHWHLALLMCMLLLASPPISLAWRCFDLVAVLLGSLTGPFVIMLWPVAAVVWGWKRRTSWMSTLLFTMTACAFIQVAALYLSGSEARYPGRLGASPLLFAKILASQVFLAALIGKNSVPYRHSYWLHAVVITVAGLAVFAYALWRGRWELKVFVIFAIMMLTGALLTPLAASPKWPILLTAWGVRYWFIPMLAFVCALVWMAGAERPTALRVVAIATLALMTVGIVREWRHPAFVDLHFRGYARQFSELPKGSTLTIPINPPGWSMALVK